MSFRVDPESVARFGRAVGDLSDDVRSAENYVRHLSITHDEARMFAQVVGTAEEVRVALKANYQQLQRVVDGSAAELERTAALYRRTDAAEAARLDSTY